MRQLGKEKKKDSELWNEEIERILLCRDPYGSYRACERILRRNTRVNCPVKSPNMKEEKGKL